MRVASAFAYADTITRLSQRQSDLSEAQLRLTSGKRVTRASDDPINAARAERALATVSKAGASLRSVDASRTAMTQVESALGDAGDLLQSVREALISGGNAGYSDSDRLSLSEEVRGLRDQLLQIANRADGAGTYLFGGKGSTVPPLVDATYPALVHYAGTPGEGTADPNLDLPMTMDGQAVWLSVGANVFAALDKAVDDLATPAGGTTKNGVVIDGTTRAQTTAENLTNLDAVMEHLLSARADAGQALNRIENTAVHLDDTTLNAKIERSAAEDLDMPSAISDFQNKQTGYDVALRTYASIQQLSLFDYIKT